MYAWGLFGLTLGLIKLWPARRASLVYLYVMDGILNLYTGALCQLLGLPVIQELCEWVPDQMNSCPAFNRWLYNKRVFKAATGALVISRTIEKRVKERCANDHPDLLIHRVPVMVDARRFATVSPAANSTFTSLPTFVYCGTYLEDVFFLIRAFVIVRAAGYECRLKIIGPCGETSGRDMLDYAGAQGLCPIDVILTGCVDEQTLKASYKAAAALLMPLFNDDKSMTRLPNKMGEYLASGRPVITCKIGDLTEFLSDNVNAYVGEPGDEQAFANNMVAVLEDPCRAERIGSAGQQACFAHLDYRAQSSDLIDFVVRCIDYRNGERRSTQRDNDQPHYVSIGEQIDDKAK
jgi:glycosyltransferase involved in cell wall biosynthesis